MKKSYLLGLVTAAVCLGSATNARTFHHAYAHNAQIANHLGGGGDDKEKKEKTKGDKKDDSMKDAKTKSISSKPSQHARNSAKEARSSIKYTQKQMMARAKVRLFFHNMFNTKYGKPVNFRSTRARNRWSKGH
jgi:nucleosome binding factor SPN SPT16 subunit